MTGARENQPTGPRTRAGQSWRAVFFTLRPLLSHRGRSLCTGLGTQPQSLWSCAEPPAEMSLGLACESPPPFFFLHGEHAACGSGAGPRDPVGGGYRDNLSQACGEQPLGCRLFPFVNLVLKARPSLQPHGVHCCHAPGSCCSLRWPPAPGKQSPRAGTQLFSTPCAHSMRNEPGRPSFGNPWSQCMRLVIAGGRFLWESRDLDTPSHVIKPSSDRMGYGEG